MAITPVQNPIIPNFNNPENAPSLLGKLISGLIGFILTIATIWTFIQLIIGGLSWITSGGDKGALQAARDKIINAIIGLFIVVAAWAIFLLLLSFFGMSSGTFNLVFPKIF